MLAVQRHALAAAPIERLPHGNPGPMRQACPVRHERHAVDDQAPLPDVGLPGHPRPNHESPECGAVRVVGAHAPQAGGVPFVQVLVLDGFHDSGNGAAEVRRYLAAAAWGLDARCRGMVRRRVCRAVSENARDFVPVFGPPHVRGNPNVLAQGVHPFPLFVRRAAVEVSFQFRGDQFGAAGVRILPIHDQVREASAPDDVDAVSVSEMEGAPSVMLCLVDHVLIESAFPYRFVPRQFGGDSGSRVSARFRVCGAWFSVGHYSFSSSDFWNRNGSPLDPRIRPSNRFRA